MFQERILVLYDGIPMAAPYYGDLDMSELPLEGLESITATRGNASVLYGPNALGGVLSLVSAKPGERGNFRLLTSVDQEGNYSARMTHGRRLGPWYYQVSAGTRQSDGWRMSDDFESFVEDSVVIEDGGVRDNADFSQWSAEAKVGREWEKAELAASGSYVNAEKGIPPATSPDVRLQYWEFPTWKKATATAAGRIELAEAVEVRGNLFYHKYDNVLKNYRNLEHTQLRYESTYDDYSTGGMLRASWQAADKITLRSALHLLMDNHRAQGNPDDPWEEFVARTYAAALEGEIWPASHLALQLGASQEWYDFDSLENVEADADAVTERTRDIAAPAFSALLTYAPSLEHRFTAAVTKRNRFPTMNQLFANIEEFAAEDVTTIDPEQAMQYSVGYEFRPQVELAAGVAGFYYDVKDLIERPDRDALFANIEEATFTGAELWASYRGASGLDATVNGTLVDASNEVSDGEAQDLPYVPDYMVQAEVGYRFGFGTRIAPSLTYRGEAVEYNDDGEPMTVPSYTVMDLRLHHELGWGVTLTLQATNLLDKDYVQEIGYPLPGRTVRLGVQYALE
jgi:outer membrane receptor protein involved in Fe transport